MVYIAITGLHQEISSFTVLSVSGLDKTISNFTVLSVSGLDKAISSFTVLGMNSFYHQSYADVLTLIALCLYTARFNDTMVYLNASLFLTS